MNCGRPPQQPGHGWLLAILGVAALTVATPVRHIAASPTLCRFCVAELRGVWAHYYGIPDWEQTIRNLHQANFNAVFPYMCSAGVAFYPSHLLPISEKAAAHNYLAEAVSAGQKYGVQIHARMLVLEALFSSEQTKSQLAQQGRLMRDSNGETLPWLCPSNPYNREQLIGVALEIVRNYAVAGLQLDYIRYPHRDCCFCEHCRHKFMRDTFGAGTDASPPSPLPLGEGLKGASHGSPLRDGESPTRQSRYGDGAGSGVRWPQDVISGSYKDAFNSWRQQQITSLVAEIAKAAKSTRPNIAVSAAVFPNWPSAQERFGQDAAAWVEQGLVDFICPMNYTADIVTLIRWQQQQRELIGERVPLVAGLGPFSDACQFDGPHQLLDQILIARDEGAAGFIVFNYNEQFAQDYLPYLAMGVTSTPASVWPALSLALPLSETEGGEARSGKREARRRGSPTSLH